MDWPQALSYFNLFTRKWRGSKSRLNLSAMLKPLLGETLLEPMILGDLTTTVVAVMHIHRVIGSLRILEVDTARALIRRRAFY